MFGLRVSGHNIDSRARIKAVAIGLPFRACLSHRSITLSLIKFASASRATRAFTLDSCLCSSSLRTYLCGKVYRNSTEAKSPPPPLPQCAELRSVPRRPSRPACYCYSTKSIVQLYRKRPATHGNPRVSSLVIYICPPQLPCRSRLDALPAV